MMARENIMPSIASCESGRMIAGIDEFMNGVGQESRN